MESILNWASTAQESIVATNGFGQITMTWWVTPYTHVMQIRSEIVSRKTDYITAILGLPFWDNHSLQRQRLGHLIFNVLVGLQDENVSWSDTD
jgi:hypothetical protein